MDRVQFIQRALTEIATGKHDYTTEQLLADSIEQELLKLRTENAINRAKSMAAVAGRSN